MFERGKFAHESRILQKYRKIIYLFLSQSTKTFGFFLSRIICFRSFKGSIVTRFVHGEIARKRGSVEKMQKKTRLRFIWLIQKILIDDESFTLSFRAHASIDRNHIDTQGKCVHLKNIEWRGPPCRLRREYKSSPRRNYTRRSKLQNHAPAKKAKSRSGFSLSGRAAAPRPEYYYTKQ